MKGIILLIITICVGAGLLTGCGGGNDQPSSPEMRAYVSAVMSLNADNEEKLNELWASVPGTETLSEEQWWPERERVFGEARTLTVEYLAALRALDPPEELRTLHERSIAYSEKFREIFQRGELAAQDRDYAELQKVDADISDLTSESDELSAEWTKITEQVMK